MPLPMPGMPAPGGPTPMGGPPMPGGGAPMGGTMGAAPPPGTGAATMPGAQAGAGAQGLTQVKLAVEMLTKALAGLPMGSPLHNNVMKAISSLSKDVAQGADDQSAIMQQLAALARSAQADPQRQAMMRAMPPGGAQPQPAPGGAPAPAMAA